MVIAFKSIIQLQKMKEFFWKITFSMTLGRKVNYMMEQNLKKQIFSQTSYNFEIWETFILFLNNSNIIVHICTQQNEWIICMFFRDIISVWKNGVNFELPSQLAFGVVLLKKIYDPKIWPFSCIQWLCSYYFVRLHTT